MISSREVQNVWKFHTFRSGSSLSVHDSHAFQRTPGPATLSRAESVHSVSWRNRRFRRSSRKHPPIYKHCMQVFFVCLLWSLIRWTDILSHFSEEHLQGDYGKPANWMFAKSLGHLHGKAFFLLLSISWWLCWFMHWWRCSSSLQLTTSQQVHCNLNEENSVPLHLEQAALYCTSIDFIGDAAPHWLLACLMSNQCSEGPSLIAHQAKLPLSNSPSQRELQSYNI